MPSLLATKRVDAVGQFTVGEPLLANAVKPEKLERLAYKDVGFDYYGNGIIATEQTRKASGAAAPSCLDIVAGRAKILAPIVVLMILAAKPGMPMARTSCSSTLRGFSLFI